VTIESRQSPVSPADSNWSGPRPSLLTLVVLSAVSPLAMNTFVPSMPSISSDLSAPYATVQLGLSLYLIMTAALQLVIGPLSDLYGRKPAVLCGLVLFLVGTAICVFAENVTMFLTGRIIQSASAVGIVLSRTIVRDIYPREKSASMIGYVVMGMAIAPMLGPALGGFIDEISGWRMSFVMLGLFGLVALGASVFNLPETNRFRGAPVRQQIASYKVLARSPLFWSFALASGLTSAMFFGYLGGGPAVATEHYKLGAAASGAYFATVALGYAFGNFLSGRYSEQRGLERMMLDGTIVATGGPVLILLALFAGIESPLAFFLPMILIGLGNGMTLPNVMAAAISIRPEAAGAASGLLGAVQIGLGALISIVAGVLVGATGDPVPLALFLLACGIAAILVTRMAIRMSTSAS
jgi:DHA1 family bicyclomycin/chloramphenicol resistance-like MFS transporter